jgi:hypothetical protein
VQEQRNTSEVVGRPRIAPTLQSSRQEARGLPGIDPIDAPALRFFVLPERGPATHGRRRKYSCTNGNQPKQCETRGGPRPRLCPHDESGFDSPRPPPCLGTTSGSIVHLHSLSIYPGNTSPVSAGPVTPTPLDLRSHCQVVHKGIRPSSPTQQ